MKWLVRSVHVVILVMALWVVARFLTAVVYAAPIVLSAIVWYWGWNESKDWMKLGTIGFSALFSLLSIQGISERPVNFGAWFDIAVLGLFPQALLLAAYLTRGISVDKSNPVTWIVGGILEVVNRPPFREL